MFFLFQNSNPKMKVFVVFALFLAVAAAFPSAESQADTKPELQPEQQNTLLAVEGNPQGDKTESEAERAKRFIFFTKFIAPWPVAYHVAYAPPVVYSAPVVTKTVTRTIAAPVVTKTVVAAPVVHKTVVTPVVETVEAAPVVTKTVAAVPAVSSVGVVKTAGVHVQAPFVDVAVGR